MKTLTLWTILLLTAANICAQKSHFYIEPQGLEGALEQAKEIRQNFSDSLKQITKSVELTPQMHQQFADSIRADRIKPQIFKDSLASFFDLQYKIALEINRPQYQESRIIWLPVAGEQSWEYQLKVKVINRQDSLIYSGTTTHTHIETDWFCGVWDCHMRPLAVAQQRINESQAYQILIKKFFEEHREVFIKKEE